MNDNQAQIVIIGGGLAGMALALILSEYGISAQIYDARPVEAVGQDERMLALSHGSWQILAQLGLMHSLQTAGKLAAISEVNVSQRNCYGRTRITAEQENLPALGFVVRAGDLALTMLQKSQDRNIVINHQQPVSPHDFPKALLLIRAEGKCEQSKVVEYQQSAIICNVSCTTPHRNIAWERFTPQGPLALLPLPGKANSYALVLTESANQAPWVEAMNDSEFLLFLQHRFGFGLAFCSVTPRLIFPLTLSYRRRVFEGNTVWVGNSAQILHPIAGQGFNLALRDVYELACLLADSVENLAQSEKLTVVLNQYARQRFLDRTPAIAFTHGLVKLFGLNLPFQKSIRGAGLLMLDILPTMKSFLARRMIFGNRGI